MAALGGPLAGALTGLLSNLVRTYLVPPPFQDPAAAYFAVVAVVIGLAAGSFARWGWLRPRRGSSTGRLVAGGGIAIALLLAMAFLAVRGWSAIGEDVRLVARSDDALLAALGWLALLIVAGTVVGLVAMLAWKRDLTAAHLVVAGAATGIVAAFIAAPIATSVFGGVTGSGADLLVAAFRQAGAEMQAAVLGQSLISDPIDKVVTFFVAYLILGALSVRTLARFPQGAHLVQQPGAEPSPGAGAEPVVTR